MNLSPESLMLILFGVVMLFSVAAFLGLFSSWLRCFLAGAPVTLPELMAMRLRKSPLDKVTEAFIRIRTHGIEMTVMEVEVEYIKDPKNFATYVDLLIEEYRKSQSSSVGEGKAEDPSGIER